MKPWSSEQASLKGDLTKILVGQGMNEDEARAMVATWTRSWFATEGLRILYVVPRPLVDELLPLKIDPAPAAVNRVLLGRIECVPPKTLAEVEAALVVIHEAKADTDEAQARLSAAVGRIQRLGRFREAFLRRLVATTKNEAAKSTAEGSIEKLVMQRESDGDDGR